LPGFSFPHTTYITDEYGKLKPGNRIILRAHNEFIAHAHKLDAWFAGVNRNPDIDIPGALAERDNGVLPLHMEHMGVDICHPFVYTTKDWIINQYYENNITDLLDLTRSCEGEFEDLDYTTYIPGDPAPICGECFWCKEREWALGEVK
jgi:7-cyano-7-deazaguanine synthase in queuosine biosynthesis